MIMIKTLKFDKIHLLNCYNYLHITNKHPIHINLEKETSTIKIQTLDAFDDCLINNSRERERGGAGRQRQRERERGVGYLIQRDEDSFSM